MLELVRGHFDRLLRYRRGRSASFVLILSVAALAACISPPPSPPGSPNTIPHATFDYVQDTGEMRIYIRATDPVHRFNNTTFVIWEDNSTPPNVIVDNYTLGSYIGVSASSFRLNTTVWDHDLWFAQEWYVEVNATATTAVEVTLFSTDISSEGEIEISSVTRPVPHRTVIPAVTEER